MGNYEIKLSDDDPAKVSSKELYKKSDIPGLTLLDEIPLLLDWWPPSTKRRFV